MIVTFYSFKGGVGRSMALVNVGEILADLGYRVVLCDWDLEAPGLERYLVAEGGSAAAPSQELTHLVAQEGLIDLLLDYKETLTRPLPEEEPAETPATHARMGRLLLRRPSSYAVPVSTDRHREGTLRLLSAGRRDGEAYERYAESVRTFDWEEFYVKWAGDAYINFFRRELTGEIETSTSEAADIVLIDSRTGVTEQGGVCTHHLADLVVLLSAANQLNREGTLWMARSLSDPKLPGLREGRRIETLPVASRIEWTAEKEELSDFRRRFRQDLRRYASSAVRSFDEFVLAAEIPYIPFYSFNERVVAREPEDDRDPKLYAAYFALAEGIVRCGVAAELLPEPASEGRVARAAFRTARPGRVRGTIFLDYTADDRQVASRVAEGLTAAGVRVCADFLLSADGSLQQQLADSLASCAGYVVLVGRNGLTPSLRAQLDFVLRRQVLQPGFRIVPILLPGVDRTILGPMLSRIYSLNLPPDLPPANDELFENLAAELGSGGSSPAALDETTQPFRGLEPFEEAQAPSFFGRDAEVRELVRLLERTAHGARALQIEGSSGVGKSSLALAGVVPAARRGWLPGGRKEWTVAVARGGPDPTVGLATAFARACNLPVSSLQESIQGSAFGLAGMIRETTAAGGAVLLVVDQLDEALPPAAAASEALAHFDAALAAAVDDPDLPFFLLTTLRNDSLESFRTHLPRLQACLDRKGLRYALGGLSEDALRETLTAPVRQAGLAFESGLAERIVRDLRGTGQTPALLGLVLLRVWEGRSGELLTHEAYDRLGGLEGVLVDNAERVVGSLPGEELRVARGLLLRLVSTSGARLVVPRDDLLAAVADDRLAEGVLRALSEVQIVTLSLDRAKLSHAALESSWPRLHDWIETARGTLKRREELEAAALSWEATGEPRDGLPSQVQLAYFADTPPASRRAQRFLARAREHQVRRKRQRRRTVAGIAAAVLLVFLVYGLVDSWRDRAKKRSLTLATRALQLSQTDPVRSLVVAVEAGEAAETARSQQALREAIRVSRELAALPHEESVREALFSPDGSRVLTSTDETTAVWETKSGRQLSSFPTPNGSYSLFSPDGSRGVTLSALGTTLWDAATGKAAHGRKIKPPLPTLNLPHTTGVFDLLEQGPLQEIGTLVERARDEQDACTAISPDGQRLAAGTTTGGLRVWTLPDLRPVAVPRRPYERVLRCAFGPDGRTVATAGDDNSAAVWDLDTGSIQILRGHDRPVTRLSFSPDGTLVATASEDGTVRLWDVRTGYSNLVLRGHTGPVLDVELSPDGRRLATASSDATVRLWDADTGAELAVLRGHATGVNTATFSPDGNQIVTASLDGTARIWTTEDDSQMETASFLELLEQARARIPETLTREKRDAMLADVPTKIDQ